MRHSSDSPLTPIDDSRRTDPDTKAGTRPSDKPGLISVVVPAFNEQDVLAAFHSRLRAVVADIEHDYEIVFVNDGSTDSTLAAMETLQATDPNIAIIDLSRNFGKEIAMTAGLDYAHGDAVVIIDADLQDPPELIPALVAQWQAGYHVVFAQREEREGETWVKRSTAHAFYRLMQFFGPVRLPLDTGDFRLMSRDAVNGLLRLRERHRFMKGLFAWVGYKQTAVRYHREPRKAGATKWSYGKLLDLSIEGFTSFTVAPLRVAMYLGLATAILAFLYGGWILFKTLFYGDPVRGYPTIMVTMLFMGGVQLIALGVIGEYLGRVFNETKQRPLYLVQTQSDSVHAGADAAPSEGGARRYQEMLRRSAPQIIADTPPAHQPVEADRNKAKR